MAWVTGHGDMASVDRRWHGLTQDRGLLGWETPPVGHCTALDNYTGQEVSPHLVYCTGGSPHYIFILTVQYRGLPTLGVQYRKFPTLGEHTCRTYTLE